MWTDATSTALTENKSNRSGDNPICCGQGSQFNRSPGQALNGRFTRLMKMRNFCQSGGFIRVIFLAKNTDIRLVWRPLSTFLFPWHYTKIPVAVSESAFSIATLYLTVQRIQITLHETQLLWQNYTEVAHLNIIK